MKYLRAMEYHEEHSRPCPKCGAPIGHWCISDSGHTNTKSHSARLHLPERNKLPDLRAKWKEWAPYEGLHPKPRPKDLQV